jgi:hypothetical protein
VPGQASRVRDRVAAPEAGLTRDGRPFRGSAAERAGPVVRRRIDRTTITWNRREERGTWHVRR